METNTNSNKKSDHHINVVRDGDMMRAVLAGRDVSVIKHFSEATIRDTLSILERESTEITFRDAYVPYEQNRFVIADLFSKGASLSEDSQAWRFFSPTSVNELMALCSAPTVLDAVLKELIPPRYEVALNNPLTDGKAIYEAVVKYGGYGTKASYVYSCLIKQLLLTFGLIQPNWTGGLHLDLRDVNESYGKRGLIFSCNLSGLLGQMDLEISHAKKDLERGLADKQKKLYIRAYADRMQTCLTNIYNHLLCFQADIGYHEQVLQGIASVFQEHKKARAMYGDLKTDPRVLKLLSNVTVFNLVASSAGAAKLPASRFNIHLESLIVRLQNVKGYKLVTASTLPLYIDVDYAKATVDRKIVRYKLGLKPENDTQLLRITKDKFGDTSYKLVTDLSDLGKSLLPQPDPHTTRNSSADSMLILSNAIKRTASRFAILFDYSGSLESLEAEGDLINELCAVGKSASIPYKSMKPLFKVKADPRLRMRLIESDSLLRTSSAVMVDALSRESDYYVELVEDNTFLPRKQFFGAISSEDILKRTEDLEVNVNVVGPTNVSKSVSLKLFDKHVADIAPLIHLPTTWSDFLLTVNSSLAMLSLAEEFGTSTGPEVAYNQLVIQGLLAKLHRDLIRNDNWSFLRYVVIEEYVVSDQDAVDWYDSLHPLMKTQIFIGLLDSLLRLMSAETGIEIDERIFSILASDSFISAFNMEVQDV